jgi:hypothetical protein
MGANQRKKKQAPAPTLEETFPKRFKSDKGVIQKNGSMAKSNGAKLSKAPFVPKVQPKPVPVTEEPIIEDSPNEGQDFGATKAALFESDEENDIDEFEGLEEGDEEDEEMYAA